MPLITYCNRSIFAASGGVGDTVKQSSDEDCRLWTTACSCHLHDWSRGPDSRSPGGQASHGHSVQKDIPGCFPTCLWHWAGTLMLYSRLHHSYIYCCHFLTIIIISVKKWTVKQTVICTTSWRFSTSPSVACQKCNDALEKQNAVHIPTVLRKHNRYQQNKNLEVLYIVNPNPHFLCVINAAVYVCREGGTPAVQAAVVSINSLVYVESHAQ